MSLPGANDARRRGMTKKSVARGDPGAPGEGRCDLARACLSIACASLHGSADARYLVASSPRPSTYLGVVAGCEVGLLVPQALYKTAIHKTVQSPVARSK